MPTWADKFLSALVLQPNVSLASDAAGIDRTTAYAWRHKSPEFARAWDDALARSVDKLEASAFRRAEESDTLTIFLLKSHRPEVYRETSKVELTGQSVPVVIIPDNGRQPASE